MGGQGRGGVDMYAVIVVVSFQVLPLEFDFMDFLITSHQHHQHMLITLVQFQIKLLTSHTNTGAGQHFNT